MQEVRTGFTAKNKQTLVTEGEAGSPFVGAKAFFFKEKSTERGGRGFISIAVINYLTTANVVGLHLIRKQVNLSGQRR